MVLYISTDTVYNQIVDEKESSKMKDFSPSYLDKLANRLEEMSGDPRIVGEDSDSRILSSLENMAGITTPNGDYQQRVCDAVNNINIGGGGGGNGIFNYNASIYNNVYNALISETAFLVFSIADELTISKVEFANDLTDLSYSCYLMPNIPISNIPNSVTNCSGMFEGGTNFNQPVNISDSVIDCSNMFSGCNHYNSIVNIGNSVTNCYLMFASCDDFNKPVTLPASVTDTAGMFRETKFNQPMVIPNSVTNCAGMFRYCYLYNHTITIPESVTDVSNLFDYCPNMSSIVRLPEKFNNGTTTAFWNNCSVSVANGTLEFY